MAAGDYTDLAHIKANGALTPVAVDQLVTDTGALDGIIAGRSAYINSRLFKRYAVPFADPVPEAVRQWCCDLVVERALTRRGANPDSDLLDAAIRAADTARAELKEAAEAENGLFDIPLRLSPTVSGISQGTPLSYSEPSPYDWIDAQAEALRER